MRGKELRISSSFELGKLEVSLYRLRNRFQDIAFDKDQTFVVLFYEIKRNETFKNLKNKI